MDDGKAKFERAYCLLLATLAALDALDLYLPAAHVNQAIHAMERDEDAVGVDFSALRKVTDDSARGLH